MTNIDRFSAADIAAFVCSGALDPREVVVDCLNDIETLEPLISAWVCVDRKGALRQATAVAERVRLGERPPLAGVPFGVKDVIDVAGLPTVAGFAPYADRPATSDAYIVARLRELGAIPLGKTHTTQFALADPAPTCNPFDLDYSPGGSSSGSGAAVGAHTIPFALGTQTGGSVLRPAAYCGAVGFKPTFNWISCAGVIPLSWSLDHLGLIARDVADMRLVFDALTAPGPMPKPARPRIGLLRQFVDDADPEIATAVNRQVKWLSAAGAEIEEIALPVEVELLQAVHRVIMETEVAADPYRSDRRAPSGLRAATGNRSRCRSADSGHLRHQGAQAAKKDSPRDRRGIGAVRRLGSAHCVDHAAADQRWVDGRSVLSGVLDVDGHAVDHTSGGAERYWPSDRDAARWPPRRG